jgi:hypothetical protein
MAFVFYNITLDLAPRRVVYSNLLARLLWLRVVKGETVIDRYNVRVTVGWRGGGIFVVVWQHIRILCAVLSLGVVMLRLRAAKASRYTVLCT